MGNRKDIGKAFREKLKDFDQSPDDKVWRAIQADLQHKKKRRILPFWFTFTGLGVLFLGIVLVWNNSGENDAAHPTVPQTQSESASEKGKISQENPDSGNTSGKNDGDSESEGSVKNTVSENNNENATPGNNGAGEKSSDHETGTKNTHRNQNTKTNADINANDLGVGKKASKNKFFKKLSNDSDRAKESAANQTKKSKNKKGKRTRSGANKKTQGDPDLPSNRNIAAWDNEMTDGTALQNKPIAQTDLNANAETPSKSTEQDETKPKTDSIPTENKNPKSAAKEVLEKAKKEAKKLSLFVYGSPTHVGYQSGVSPYDRRLNNNSPTSKTMLSYGAYAIYEATDRWSLRFGIGIINQKSVTEDATVNTLDYSGINYTKNSNVAIYAQSNATKMDLIQEVSYTEVPLELKYAILNGKFGISAFGGFSLRFLGKNDISAETSNGMRFDVGETKNLSGNAFTINAGVGFDYKFAKRIRFNVEPVFKYHLNDYKNVGIRPYSIGVLTGLQFSLK